MDYVKEFVKYQLDTNPTPHTEWSEKERKKKSREFFEFVTLFYFPEENRQENKLNLAKLRKHIAKKNKTERNYYFITVCPPEHITLKESLKAIKSLLAWSCWQEIIAVSEQRSSNEEFYGIHYHILAKKSKKYAPSNVKQRLSRLKKKWNTDIQIIDEKFAKDKQNYLFEKWGTTNNGEKKAKVMEMDEIWRKKHGLPRYFGEKLILTN